MSDIFYTNATPSYDSFSTTHIEVVGKDRNGKDVRKISIDKRDQDWQIGRNLSGMNFVIDAKRWEEESEYFMV